MIRSTSRRAGVLGGIVVLAASVLTTFAAPAGAATKNPCKVLKTSEIQQAFGGTVAAGKKGLSTAVSSQCEYEVSANGERPNGTVIVHVMTTGAKAAHDGLKKQGTIYTPIDGVANSLYADSLKVASILKGDVLVGVQGDFVITDPLPIHHYDDKVQLTTLVQQAAKRV